MQHTERNPGTGKNKGGHCLSAAYIDGNALGSNSDILINLNDLVNSDHKDTEHTAALLVSIPIATR